VSRCAAAAEAGDVVGVGHNIEDTRAAAALAADGDVDGERRAEILAKPRNGPATAPIAAVPRRRAQPMRRRL